MAHGGGDAYYSDDFEDSGAEENDVPTITIYKPSKGAGLVVKPNTQKPKTCPHKQRVLSDAESQEELDPVEEDFDHSTPPQYRSSAEIEVPVEDTDDSPRLHSQESPPGDHEWDPDPDIDELVKATKTMILKAEPKTTFGAPKPAVTKSTGGLIRNKFAGVGGKLKGKATASRSNYSLKSTGSQHNFNLSVVGVGKRERRPPVTTVVSSNYGKDINRLRAPLRLGLAKPSGNVAQRVASAKRMTINDLKNKISTLNEEIVELRKENRSLKHVERRQENVIRRWEGKDADLPRLLQQHKYDLASSADMLRKSQAHCRDLDTKLRAYANKIGKLETELKALKSLASKDDLEARSTLQQNVEILSSNLTGTEARLRHYMRHVEILEKNYNHQLANEQQKLIKANNHALELKQEITRLKLALRDKDRMLNYIQMRSTGRNLLRAFQEDERKHSMKFTASTPTLS